MEEESGDEAEQNELWERMEALEAKLAKKEEEEKKA